MHWHIGCSGFSYSDWKEVFYPKGLPQNKWFSFYSENFSTLELNVTFYRFPRLASLQSWYNKSPEAFQFSLKAPRLITHFKQFTETQTMLSDFYGTVREGLKSKLACVLFQLPASITYSEEFLARIISSLDLSFTNVIEFRHESWWNEQVYTTLANHNVCFCSISHPKLPPKIICNTAIVYYRFHGVPVLYKSQYKESELFEIAKQTGDCKNVKKVFIYFNNTWGLAGIVNAQQMEHLHLKV